MVLKPKKAKAVHRMMPGRGSPKTRAACHRDEKHKEKAQSRVQYRHAALAQPVGDQPGPQRAEDDAGRRDAKNGGHVRSRHAFDITHPDRGP